MYPLWDKVIEPALVAAQARRVIEIGALRGETTVRLLDALGPDSELHVIDPEPMFDPAEHARRFPGRYAFHRDISHNVLPKLPPVDAVLVDGDHNWFTVYNELRMLRETARRSDSPLPLLILHDVCWPYGRRDLYYAPERIPEDARQPFAAGGLLPGRTDLAEGEGMNQHLDNAVEEGGARKGVMSALDDFVAEHDRPLRTVVLPIYYGLALVAEEELLAARPELARLLDWLGSVEGRYECLELSEAIRIHEQVAHHELQYSSRERLARTAGRYLDLLKGALLDEHYLENELRIEHLLECVATRAEVSRRKLRDPARYMSQELRERMQTRQSGDPSQASAGYNGSSAGLAYTGVGRQRLDQLEQCVKTIREEGVGGDIVDCGADRSGSAIFLRGLLEAYYLGRRRVWVAQRFCGGREPAENGAPDFAYDLNTVRDAFQRFKLLDDRVRFIQGPPAETLAEAPLDDVALLRVDGHDADDVRGALEAVYARMSPGGFVVVDDYWDERCQAAVEAFRSEHGVVEPLERIDWSGAAWRKSAEEQTIPAQAADYERPRRWRRSATKALSMVVVVHNMRREAARTLYSLSSKYQCGLGDLDYEVIVVENGSSPDERLGEQFVRGFGPEFTYVDLGEASTPSPAPALNRGIELSSGRTVALMIDGAHVLTPGVLRLALLGLSAYEPAIVSTQQWYVGPGEQNEAVAKGYDRDYEDRLFAQIGWPVDGYRLFEIGHFIGDRDWFDGQWESNCIFASRDLLEQFGAMDERFSMPGGGFVNLDFFERMASAPGVNLVTLLGEGSFHQVHGGTTTNLGESAERAKVLRGYGGHYSELRGRAFRVPAAEVQYIGSLPGPARRTRARRMGAPEYFKQAHVVGTDGKPRAPVPVPEELRLEFVDAVWRSQQSRQATWLGKWVSKLPTDLATYQELVFGVRPDWIIETGTWGGGRAMYLASVCELTGKGRVLSVDANPAERLVEHERVMYLHRDPTEPETAEAVRGLVGERARCLVILGAAKLAELMAMYEHYAPLVPVGSYIVLEDTILNGHPVWTGFGPGPWEAAKRIVDLGEFERDTHVERYSLTFNPGGFLKRVKEAGA